MSPASEDVIKKLRSMHFPLEGTGDLDVVLDKIGDVSYVLIGEASHGTSEYYRWRSQLTKRLIEEKGFSFVVVEGDWPDCYMINRYVKDEKDSGSSAADVLRNFNRWPTWMWANREIAEFVEWLREHNDNNDKDVGFYGMDVYSLWESLREIMRYLRRKDADALDAAKKAFLCFEPYNENMEDYARANLFVPSSCESEVAEMLSKIRKDAKVFQKDKDGFFSLEQNAIVVKNADEYYRTMIRGGARSWNIRDSHMVETVERLMRHHGENAKCVVWAHNTHIGDARATDMVRAGMVSVGQLLRQNHPDDTFIIGFGSYEGSVIASPYWGAQMERMEVPKALRGSFEHMLHSIGSEDKVIVFDKAHGMFTEAPNKDTLFEPVGHRAIGVVYSPYAEHGNYVPSVMPLRYDAFIYLDRTHALNPIDVKADTREEDTYPFGV